MKEDIERIQAVISKLQEMDIQSTYKNMMCLLACINTLTQVSDHLNTLKVVNEQTEEEPIVRIQPVNSEE